MDTHSSTNILCQRLQNHRPFFMLKRLPLPTIMVGKLHMFRPFFSNALHIWKGIACVPFVLHFNNPTTHWVGYGA
jgi:hypothetical protein